MLNEYTGADIFGVYVQLRLNWPKNSKQGTRKHGVPTLPKTHVEYIAELTPL